MWLRLIFRFLLDPPSPCKSSASPSKSLSNLLLAILCEWEWLQNGMNSSMAENYRLLSYKTARKSNSSEENRNTQEQEGHTAVRPRQHDRASTTTGHGEHHGLPMMVSGSTVPSFFERCFLVLRLGSRVFALDHRSWAY